MRLAPYFEQQAAFNNVNFSLTYAHAANITLAGVQISSLICPSDGDAAAKHPVPSKAAGFTYGVYNDTYPTGQTWMQADTSYGANACLWALTNYINYDKTNSPNAPSAARIANQHGPMFCESSVSIAGITDGTSNTLAFGEHSHTKLKRLFRPPFQTSDLSNQIPDDNKWNSGNTFDVQIESWHSPNFQDNGSNDGNNLGTNAAFFLTSDHPGGVNFAFCDGSVRFIKNSVSKLEDRPVDRQPNRRLLRQHHQDLELPAGGPARGLPGPGHPNQRRDRQRGSALIGVLPDDPGGAAPRPRAPRLHPGSRGSDRSPPLRCADSASSPRLLASALPSAWGSLGCEPSPPPLKPGGPHQGVMIPLPGAGGFAEFVIEPLPAGKVPPRMAPTELALYFLNADRAKPLESLPTEVAVEVLDPESRQTMNRPMTPSPRSGNPVGSARFASGPIDRDYSQFPITGTLKANRGGPINVPF